MNCGTARKLALAVEALEVIEFIPGDVEKLTIEQLKSLILANQIEAKAALEAIQQGSSCNKE